MDGAEGPEGPAGPPGPSGSLDASAGRVIYLPLNDGGGQLAFDYGGRQLAAYLGLSSAAEARDPQWSTAGKLGGALSFDGTDDCVQFDDAPELLHWESGLTVMAWAKRTGPLVDPVQGGNLVAKHFTLNSRSWHLRVTPSNTFEFWLADNTDSPHVLTSPAGVTSALNTWMHVAGTYDRQSGLQRIYVDGAQVAEVSAGSFSIAQKSVRATVGCYHNSSDGSAMRAHFTGLIDEVMVFNRALGPEAVAAYAGAVP